MSTRIVMISDTHSRTPRISQIPNGDVLIHAGDLLQDPQGIKTYQDEIKQLDWIKNASHSFKVVIGGNHDSFLGHLYNNPLAPDSAAKKAIQDAFSDTNHGFRYLQDEACEIVVRGHTWRVFGSPKSLKGNTSLDDRWEMHHPVQHRHPHRPRPATRSPSHRLPIPR